VREITTNGLYRERPASGVILRAHGSVHIRLSTYHWSERWNRVDGNAEMRPHGVR
jgi:hypothetical protein